MHNIICLSLLALTELPYAADAYHRRTVQRELPAQSAGMIVRTTSLSSRACNADLNSAGAFLLGAG